MTTTQELDLLLRNLEDTRLELKAARNSFDKTHDLPNYCAALANEGGGKLILGVNNVGVIVGTSAFLGTHNTLSHYLFIKIHVRVNVEELHHKNGRVLLFNVPSKPPGQPVKSNGRYLMRAGESLVEMDNPTLTAMLTETQPDYSALIVPGYSVEDLDDAAIDKLRALCHQKSKNDNHLSSTPEQFLSDLSLLSNGQITNAALILLGKKSVLDAVIPASEIILEWRQSTDKLPYDLRLSWREPFITVFDLIWEEINKRNLRTSYRDGFIQKDILAFDQDSIREAILNAVTHRDYSLSSRSVIILASPESIIITSPGGFMPGITPENAINETSWRNRRLAETLEKAGLIERSGQGLDIIFKAAISNGKGLPSLSNSDAYSVVLEIPASVKDPHFISFLEKIVSEKRVPLTLAQIIELENIRNKGVVSKPLNKDKFLDLGIIEKVGKTSGAKYMLSHKYYLYEGRPGLHTRLAGLSRKKRKELVLEYFKKNSKGTFNDFKDIFTELKPMDISNLLQELKREGKIEHEGPSKSGYWRLK